MGVIVDVKRKGCLDFFILPLFASRITLHSLRPPKSTLADFFNSPC